MMKYLPRYRFAPLQWVILCGILLSRIGTSMMMPFFVIFLTQELKLSFAMAGFVSGLSFISYLFGGICGGYLSDRYGRKLIFSLSLFSYALSFVLFGFAAATVRQPGIVEPVFCAINLLAGLNRSCIDTLGQAILADLALPEQKTELFSLRYTMANIGNGIGPLLGAMLGFVGTAQGFYLTGAFCFAYFILFTVASYGKSITALEEKGNKNTQSALRLTEVLQVLGQDRAMCLFLLGGIVVTMVFSQMETTLGLIVMQRVGAPELFALIMATNAVAVVVLQLPVTAYFLKRYSMLTTMRIGCLLLALGLLGNAFSGNTPHFYLASQVVFTLGEILIFPVNAMFVESIAPPNLRGSYFGAMSFLQVGRAVGPVMGGFLLQHSGAYVALFAFAALSLAATLIYRSGNRAVERREERRTILAEN